jgi:hypothetical protein
VEGTGLVVGSCGPGFVEPPWSYRAMDDRVELDIMGAVTTFGLAEGSG